MEEGRLWVFKTGSAELESFLQTGEPAKQVVRPLAGPFGLTIKAVASDVIDEYLAAWQAATDRQDGVCRTCRRRADPTDSAGGNRE